ncbi:phosphodiester glycosidase family protein [Leptolyngbya iicbica]|uniref:Phosphodiester glycosidase family protein n=1 Tax=Lyngbya confervoides BDU141951 TaxID=1574623 RepID=A0A8T6QSG7_9CYAN|nr:phosphodiester glycosidase family protein [Leptolyngbya sp. LK]
MSLSLGVAIVVEAASSALSAEQNQAVPKLVPAVAQLPTQAQGTSVTLGNTTVPIPWEQRGDRIGLADLPLMSHLGLDLQNSTTADQQPLVWFSDDADFVSTWFSQGYRYLDLTAWAAQRGWHLVPDGNNLRIQAPTGTVMAGRRGKQTWGDRLVLDVDRPVLWSFDEDATAFTLTIQAQAGAAFDPAALTTGEGNELNSLTVTTSGGQIQIRGTFDSTSRPRVWSLPNPNRIVIDISQTDVVPREIRWAPGVLWKQQYLRVGDRAFPVHQIWLSLSDRTQLMPIWGNPAQLPGITPLKTMAENAQAYVAINAGFFNRNNQLPLGAIRRDGQWISGPILGRGAIAWNAQRQFTLSRLSLAHTLTTQQGQSLTVNHINSGYVQAGIGLYTTAWGRTYTPIVDGELLITVEGNRVTRQTPAGGAGTGTYPIPPQGYLLALRSFNSAAQSLPVGTTVALTPDLRPPNFANFPSAIGGGPVLVQNGQIVANAQAEGFSAAFAAQAAPRSAIGVTPDGNLMLVAIHFSPGGRGPTLREAAEIMRQLGATDALNLDGGNSTSLYLGGTLINRHGSTVGRVHNGLGVFLAAPE